MATDITDPNTNYSRDITRKLIKTIREEKNIRMIIFNDKILGKEGLCTNNDNTKFNQNIHILFDPDKKQDRSVYADIIEIN